MKSRPSQPAPPPPPELTQDVVKQIIGGLYGDPATLHATIARFYHPDVKLTGTLVDIEGRWEVFRALRAVSTLWTSQPQIVQVVVDKEALAAVVVVDEVFKPNVPLVKGVLPALVCPQVICLSFTRHAHAPSAPAGVVVKEQAVSVSTTYLPHLLGPPGVWAYTRVAKAVNGWLLDRVCDTTEFVSALATFAGKQLMGGAGGSAAFSAKPGTASEGRPTGTQQLAM